MATPHLDIDRAVEALIYATAVGNDSVAAQAFGISIQTLSLYRRRLKTDEKLTKALNLKLATLEAQGKTPKPNYPTIREVLGEALLALQDSSKTLKALSERTRSSLEGSSKLEADIESLKAKLKAKPNNPANLEKLKSLLEQSRNVYGWATPEYLQELSNLTNAITESYAQISEIEIARKGLEEYLDLIRAQLRGTGQVQTQEEIYEVLDP